MLLAEAVGPFLAAATEDCSEKLVVESPGQGLPFWQSRKGLRRTAGPMSPSDSAGMPGKAPSRPQEPFQGREEGPWATFDHQADSGASLAILGRKLLYR